MLPWPARSRSRSFTFNTFTLTALNRSSNSRSLVCHHRCQKTRFEKVANSMKKGAAGKKEARRFNPRVTNYVRFPYGVDKAIRVENSILLLMGDTLWFFSALAMNRQICGIHHVEYKHKDGQICHASGIYVDSELSIASVPGAMDKCGLNEFCLLFVDSSGVFHVLDHLRQFCPLSFRVDGVDSGAEIKDMAGSLSRQGEFTLLTRKWVRVLRLSKTGQLEVCFHANNMGSGVFPYADGFLVNINTTLFLIRDGTMREYLRTGIVDQFVTSGDKIVTLRGCEGRGSGIFSVLRARRQVFAVKGAKGKFDSDLRIFDMCDPYFVATLSGRLLVIDTRYQDRAFHCHITRYKKLRLEPVSKVICQVRRHDLFVFLFSAHQPRKALVIEVPLEVLERLADEEEEEDAGDDLGWLVGR